MILFLKQLILKHCSEVMLISAFSIANNLGVNQNVTNNLGLPKFLVNKWLNIKPNKSKFNNSQNRVDNADDVSVYTDTTISKLSVISNDVAANSIRQSRYGNTRLRLRSHDTEELDGVRQFSGGPINFDRQTKLTSTYLYYLVTPILILNFWPNNTLI